MIELIELLGRQDVSWTLRRGALAYAILQVPRKWQDTVSIVVKHAEYGDGLHQVSGTVLRWRLNGFEEFAAAVDVPLKTEFGRGFRREQKDEMYRLMLGVLQLASRFGVGSEVSKISCNRVQARLRGLVCEVVQEYWKQQRPHY